MAPSHQTRRRAVLVLVVGSAVACLAWTAGCGGASGSPGAGSGSGASDGAALVTERCTRCHTRDRIDAATHDRAAWEATVARMRGKGARLTDAEAASVVDYLTTR